VRSAVSIWSFIVYVGDRHVVAVLSFFTVVLFTFASRYFLCCVVFHFLVCSCIGRMGMLLYTVLHHDLVVLVIF
jgi:hypothetical protein